MIREVEKLIGEKEMLPDGTPVIVALSGGADSVCLLALLLYLAPVHGWKVKALHVNHLIRGDEAVRDEFFVRDLCQKWQTELAIVRKDVPTFAKDRGLSLEEAGRICRLSAFDDAAEQWEEKDGFKPETVKIALAHNCDDNAETILHNLLRGSGLRGLGGIRPVQKRLVRPLLGVRREEIRDFLLENDIPWCEDSTNADTSYTRNFIRNDILPMMEKGVNPHAVENIVHAGELAREAEEALMAQAEEVFKADGRVKKNGAVIRLSAYLKQSPAIRSYIIRYMTDLIAPNLRDLTSRHFAMITDIFSGETGKRADLPGGLVAGRDYDELWICRSDEDIPVKPSEQKWELNQQGGEAGEISFKVFPWQKGSEIPKNEWSKWFDYDKISGALSVRTRKSGDYLTIAGGVRKSLNRFFIDEKIPRDERDKILLLTEGNHVLWVVGMRISEYYKVTDDTKLILQAEKKEG